VQSPRGWGYNKDGLEKGKGVQLLMVENDPLIYERQNSIRVANQLSAIKIFRQGMASPSSLAAGMGISVTASIKILKELQKNKIIVTHRPPKNQKWGKGRPPVLYELNSKVGLIGGISLSGALIRFAIAELDGRILVEKTLEANGLIDQRVLGEIIAAVKEALKLPEIGGRPLLTVCVSAPGKIDKKSGQFVYSICIDNYANLNLEKVFSEAFNAPVIVYHDLFLCSVGERTSSILPKDADNFLVSYIDRYAGSALILNKKLFEGSHGFAGEEPNFILPASEMVDAYGGCYYTLNDLCEELLEAAKKQPTHPFAQKKKLHVAEVLDLASQGDPLVLSFIDKAAKRNAMHLLALVNLLDLDCIVIEGRFVNFGDPFKKALLRYYHEIDGNHNTAEILFSGLGDRSSLLGALYQGSNLYFLSLCERMTKSRTNSIHYDVRRYFGDNF
jgi:predicted NBD/HSP70 family sugar kinase